MLYTRSGLFPLYFNFINDVMKNSISKLPWLITCNDMYIKYVYRIRFFFFNIYIYIYMCVCRMTCEFAHYLIYAAHQGPCLIYLFGRNLEGKTHQMGHDDDKERNVL
jgi:hypothetical protein